MDILLVEDNREVRDSLSEFLRQLGHRVVECANGKEAVSCMHNQSPHLVLSDIHMPEMDGNQLLQEIKSTPAWKSVEVILFTGYGDIRGAVDAMRDGAYDYLLKPVNVKELALVLDRLSQYLSLKEENVRLTEHLDLEVKKFQQNI